MLELCQFFLFQDGIISFSHTICFLFFWDVFLFFVFCNDYFFLVNGGILWSDVLFVVVMEISV